MASGPTSSSTATACVRIYSDDTSATACIPYQPFLTEFRELIASNARRWVAEILYPKNWRWFHAFSGFAEPVLHRPPVEIVAAIHRAQERLPVVQRRARKRRAFIVQLRRAAA